MSRRSLSRVAMQRISNCCSVDLLEARRLMSSTLRIVAYNIEDDINGATTPLPGLYSVLEGIGEEKVAGNVRPIDILGLEETTSNADVQPIVTNLNTYYGGTAVYAESSYQGTQDGSNNDGNGPNALVYNTSTLKLLASVGIVTPEGATNGVYRQPIRYEFQPVGDTGTTGIFYVYVAHTKSGTTSADAKARGQEATIIRNDEATLPSTASVIYEGDLNSNPPEAMFTNFEATGQGEAFDPFGFPSSPTLVQESDSSTSLKFRDDYQLQTSNVFNDTGAINYVSGSLHNFGNNGSVTNASSSSNTALNTDLVTDGGTFIPASTIYTDLGTASDHLPVVSDYTIASSTVTPTIGAFAVSPTTVNSGGAFTLTASSVTETGGTISNVKFYEETNGTAGFQSTDTLIGTGTESGTTWTLAATAPTPVGSYTYYAVATDASGNSSAASSAALTVTSAPTIGSFAVSPTAVIVGGSFTLTASSVVETGGTISNVKFYEETNGTAGFQTTDTLIGTGTASGTTWTLGATAPSVAGTYTYYAVATDASGKSSAASSAALTVSSALPTIGSFALSPTSVVTGGSFTFTASGVTETGGTISSVKFYEETNGTAGFQSTDTLIGSGTASGTTWTLAATAPATAGTYTYYAVATDSTGNSSAASSAALTVTSSGGGGTTGAQLTWDVAGQTAFGTQGLKATTVATGNTNSTGLTRGSGVTTTGTAAANAWGGANWASTSTAGISGNETVTFGLTVSAGFTESLSSIALNYRHSATGPSNGFWQYQIGTGAFTLISDVTNEFSSTSSSGAAITPLSLSGVTALQNLAAGTIVNLRLTPYGSTSSAGTWYVYDITGSDLVVNGSTGSTPAVKFATTPTASPAVMTFSDTPLSASSLLDDIT
jgi:hypothetical protein